MNDHLKLWATTIAVFVVIVAVGKLFSLPRTVVHVVAAFYGITYHVPKVKQLLNR